MANTPIHLPLQNPNNELISTLDRSKTGVKGLVDSGIQSIPLPFVRPLHQQPHASEVCKAQHIPVVDLEGVQGPRRPQILRQISQACETWGFFQVVNHGVPTSLLKEMIDAVHRYNHEPVEEKAKYYSHDFNKAVRYAPSFNLPNDKVLDWKDTLRVFYTPNPPDLNEWPVSCREAVLNYSKEIRVLAATLLTLLSEALCLPPDYLMKIDCMGRQTVAMNYYPPCPQPNLSLGISGHSDPGSVTLLLQDQVGGLQVSNDGRWVTVDPLPGSLVVNIGDRLQIVSNDKFKSVEHRAVTNSRSPRVSIATFFSPESDSTLKFGPIPELLNERNPAHYREIGNDEYMRHFLNRGLKGKSLLEVVRLP